MSLNVDLLKGEHRSSWESAVATFSFDRTQTQITAAGANFSRRFLPENRDRRRMENSTYVPTSLQSPALMVLASTAEASREAAAAAAMHLGGGSGSNHPFSGSDAKDIHVPFTASSFTSLPPGLYGTQPSDGFAHLLHMHAPFLTPNMDRALSFINPTGGGAFRPVTSDRNGFHSAFMPATKFASKLSDQNGGGILHRGLHPSLQTSRPSPHPLTSLVNSSKGQSPFCGGGSSNNGGGGGGSSLSPMHIKDEGFSDHDTTSGSDLAERLTGTPASDITDGTERSTPDETSMRRAKKRQLFDGQSPCCPVCGVTLRGGEFEFHFIHEIERLSKISRLVKKSSRDSSQKNSSLTPSSSSNSNGNGKKKDSPNQSNAVPEKSTSPEARWESYQRVRTNRQGRLSARSKIKKRRAADEIVCPICNERVNGTPEELNAHAEQCLHKRDLHCDEDEPVDVEGESYEEYEWAGQTRIRATSLLQGGFSASGFQTTSCRTQPQDDEDVDLNVDGDDSATYGQAQYSEMDLISCSCDHETTSGGEDARNLILSGNNNNHMITYGSDGSGSQHVKLENDGWNTDQYTGSSPDPEGQESRGGTGDTTTTYSHFSKRTTSLGISLGVEQTLAALKKRIRELEDMSHSQDSLRSKCRICLDPYNVPLVSVSCWHVHCEECWLRTLGAKKLCPQCNMITSPSDLRRIYL